MQNPNVSEEEHQASQEDRSAAAPQVSPPCPAPISTFQRGVIIQGSKYHSRLLALSITFSVALTYRDSLSFWMSTPNARFHLQASHARMDGQSPTAGHTQRHLNGQNVSQQPFSVVGQSPDLRQKVGDLSTTSGTGGGEGGGDLRPSYLCDDVRLNLNLRELGEDVSIEMNPNATDDQVRFWPSSLSLLAASYLPVFPPLPLFWLKAWCENDCSIWS